MAIMLNAIGESPTPSALAESGVTMADSNGNAGEGEAFDGDAVFHDYRKTPRVARKVGHLTIAADAIDPSRSDTLAAIVPGAMAP